MASTYGKYGYRLIAGMKRNPGLGADNYSKGGAYLARGRSEDLTQAPS